MKVLILGGYGTFGGRLAHLLRDEPRLTLFVAGRSCTRAEAFCAALGGRARAIPVAVDRAGVEDVLAALAPDVLVDATGPFQDYGDAPYAVVEACIRHRVNYLDLADGATFVRGIAALSDRASTAGTWALSGVSSFPVLTVAAATEISSDLDDVSSVEGGIAPSPYAGVGPNVIRAISGYAGQPLTLRRGGRDVAVRALTESRYRTIRPPGTTPLPTLRFSLVDVPDLRAVPDRFPSVRDVWMGAGPVPEVLHRALNVLSRLVAMRLLPSLSFLAPVIGWVSNRVRWGEHRGGMYVTVEGSRDGVPAWRSWHLVAEGDDGPLIPSMAAASVILRALDGRPPEVGARSAADELSLADYAPMFAGRRIVTGFRRSEDEAADTPPYARILGDAIERTPAAVRDFHRAPPGSVFAGAADVTRGRGLAARIAAWVAGFPPTGRSVPLTVRVDRSGGEETWTRDYDGHRMTSVQRPGEGRWSGLLVERLGPVTVGTAPVVVGASLRLVVRRWSLFGVPMPMTLAPTGEIREMQDGQGRYVFHVEVSSALTGPVVTYRGWLRPVDADVPSAGAGMVGGVAVG